jgi:hypothetical protein
VSRVETGRVAAMQRDVEDMLDLYRVEGERREALLELARQARRKEDWWDAYGDFPNVRTYTAFERAANSIRIWQSMLIPGLLVLPFDADPHGGLAESFRMLGFPDAADPDLVHLEHPTGDIYLTSAGQVARYRELLQRAQAFALPAPRTAAFLLDLRRAAR